MRVVSYCTSAFYMTLLLLVAGSCDLNKIEYTENDDLTVRNEVVADAYFEDATDITNTAVASTAETTPGIVPVSDNRFVCAITTLSIDAASTLLNPLGAFSIDFGSGCQDKHGNIRSGKIILAFAGRRYVPGSAVSTTFNNYIVNGIKMEGTYTVTNSPSSVSTHPQFTVSLSGGKLTWPDGTSATRDCEYTREWIRTNTGESDEWYISGEAAGVNRIGKEYTLTIRKKLVYRKNCQASDKKMIPSSGKASLVANNKEAVIDFGDGSCDQLVTITINGKSTVVDLSNSN